MMPRLWCVSGASSPPCHKLLPLATTLWCPMSLKGKVNGRRENRVLWRRDTELSWALKKGSLCLRCVTVGVRAEWEDEKSSLV